MFLKNRFAIPLIDAINGGPPKAFQCIVNVWQPSTYDALAEDEDYIPCGKVTVTEHGMRAHLKSVHNWKEQECLYSMEPPTDHGSAETRKQLRVSPDPKKTLPGQLSLENQESTIGNTINSTVAIENGTESPKPISEETLSASVELNQK